MHLTAEAFRLKLIHAGCFKHFIGILPPGLSCVMQHNHIEGGTFFFFILYNFNPALTDYALIHSGIAAGNVSGHNLTLGIRFKGGIAGLFDKVDFSALLCPVEVKGKPSLTLLPAKVKRNYVHPALVVETKAAAAAGR